jgi:PAS domain-containing protein
MPPLSTRTDPQAQLRLDALSRLSNDQAEIATRSNPMKALTVLLELASSAETAPDALALLHELQVHQVELELQAEELRRSRLETESSLARHTTLYDRAPVPYLTVDACLVVREANAAAARLLRVGRDELPGRSLVAHVSPRGAAALGDLLAQVARDRSAGSALLPPAALAGATGALQALVENDTAPGRFLVVLVEPGSRSVATDANTP